MESRHYLLIKSGVGRQEHRMLHAAGTPKEDFEYNLH